jgi:hypothetical protein
MWRGKFPGRKQVKDEKVGRFLIAESAGGERNYPVEL